MAYLDTIAPNPDNFLSSYPARLDLRSEFNAMAQAWVAQTRGDGTLNGYICISIEW